MEFNAEAMGEHVLIRGRSKAEETLDNLQKACQRRIAELNNMRAIDLSCADYVGAAALEGQIYELSQVLKIISAGGGSRC
jgi:hypothetical protein